MTEDLKTLISDKKKAVDREKWSQAATLCNCIGSELERQGQFQKALESHQEELRYLEIVNDKMGMGVANRRIGECYAFMHEYGLAFKHVKIYLETAVSMEDKIEQQRAWTTLGRIYYMKSSYERDQEMNTSNTLEKSERAYVNALGLLDEIKDQLSSKEESEMKAGLLLNLGLVFDAKKNVYQCAQSIGDAILLAHKFALFEMLHRCQTSLAGVYHRHGMLNKALLLYDKSIDPAEKLRDKLLLCESLHSKALLLVALTDFQAAKKALKRAYKTKSPNEEDHKKIIQNLKVCIGLCKTQTELQNLVGDSTHERKVLLEKIADALASLNLYKLSIEYYLMTLEHMTKNDYSPQDMAPIYFSIAATYQDDGNLSKALEYLKIELECNEDRPPEKVKSLWKMAEYFEELKDATKEEEALLQALSTAEGIQNQSFLASSLQKLCAFYKRNGDKDKRLSMKTRLRSLPPQESTEESEPEEDTQDIFGDIRLSEMSESDEEPVKGYLRARRRRKPAQRVNEKGESALHQACINNNLTVVKRLVDSGSDINTRDHCGWTPLHEACNYGFYDIAEYLVDHGADIHDRGGEGCEGVTPLHDAAICGHMDIMRMLISKGASVTVCDNHGRTPLETLVHWKTDSVMEGHYLDSETLSLYDNTVEYLKTLMTQAGQPPKLDFLESTSSQQNTANLSAQKPQRLSKATEKRVISESSSDSISDEESPEVPYKTASDNLGWDDADQAQSEYKSVMTSLRKSAKTVILEKKIEPPPEPKDALINESEYVDEWLIKDTNQPPRAQKKRRKKRRLNVRTSKCIDNYLTTNDDSQHSTGSDVVINEDFTNEPMIVSEVNPVVTQINSTVTNIPNPITTVSTPVNQVTRNITLKVRIEDKLILVPVTDDTCLVSWLAKEAAERYQDLVGTKLHLTLMTKDGALLSGNDSVMKLFSNNDEVLTSVECFEEPSLVERYEKVCDKRKIKPMMSLKGYLKPFDACKKLNLTGVPLPKIQIAPIFASLSLFKNIQSLDISETVIGDEHSSHVINCFPSFVSVVSLNMRCCGISSKTLKSMADHIQSRNSDILPSLRELNLSYNKFNSNCGYYLGTLLTLPSLTVLDVESCDLSPSIFLDDSLCRALQACTRLEKFVISGNAQYGSSIEAYLKYLPKSNLTRLDLSHVPIENVDFRNLLSNFLSSELPTLRELSLQECRVKSSDLLALQSVLHQCPFLTLVNLSYNLDLTSWDVCSFIQFLVSNTMVREINAIQTCEWDESSIETLTQALSKRKLKYVALDIMTESSQDVLMQTWDSTWGIQAKSLALGFCELRIS